MNGWEKLKILSGAFAAVVIPVAAIWIGNTYSAALKERELQGRFVEIAVDILRREPETEAAPLRKWATQVIDKYAGVPLTQDVQQDLIKSSSLPEASATMTNSIVSVSESDLPRVIAGFKAAGATDIKSVKQPDGRYTVIARWPRINLR